MPRCPPSLCESGHVRQRGFRGERRGGAADEARCEHGSGGEQQDELVGDAGERGRPGRRVSGAIRRSHDDAARARQRGPTAGGAAPGLGHQHGAHRDAALALERDEGGERIGARGSQATTAPTPVSAAVGRAPARSERRWSSR